MAQLSVTSREQPASAWARLEAFVRINRPQFVAVLLAILLAWTALSWFRTIETVVRYYSPLPSWDYWRIPFDAVRYKTVGLHFFWEQHNEHRIVFPEIIFFLDLLLWRGRMFLPLALSFLCYLGTWLVLVWTVLSDKYLSRSVRAIAILLSGIIIGWSGSAVVLASAFLLQWTLMQLGVLLAFAFLARLKNSSKNVYLGGAIVFAVIATYTSANALLLWPVLLSAALLLRLSRRRVFALAVAAVLAVGLYFVGYHFSKQTNISNLFLHPFYTAGFIGSYFSMPFGGMKGPKFGAWLGLISIALVIVLAVVAARKRLLASQLGVLLFGWYVFTFLTALITAAGRMDPGDPTFSGAKAPRYVVVPLVTWAVFVLISIWVSARCRWKFVSTPVIALLVMLLLLTGFPKLRWWCQRNQDLFANEQMTALSVEDGLTDRLMLRKIFPQPEFVQPLVEYLQENHLSVFAGHHYKWLGRAASGFARKMPGPASAQISYIVPVIGGLEVVGWADESEQRHPPQWLMLTNEKDEIVGFGRKLPSGLPQHLRAANVAYSLGWVGFVNSQFKAQSYSVYAIEKAGLVPFLGSFSAPVIASVKPAEAGPVLPGIDWHMDPSWTLNGIPARVDFGVAPSGRIYSSWSGSDTNTGQIVSSPFAAPASGCFVLPVLTGPYIGGQSVEVSDADTGHVLDRLPTQEGALVWMFWRFSLPPTTKHLRVIARDEGKNWGQWVAIAEPAECR